MIEKSPHHWAKFRVVFLRSFTYKSERSMVVWWNVPRFVGVYPLRDIVTVGDYFVKAGRDPQKTGRMNMERQDFGNGRGKFAAPAHSFTDEKI